MPRTVHDPLDHAECGRRLNTPLARRKGWALLAPNTELAHGSPAPTAAGSGGSDYVLYFHGTPVLTFHHDGGVTYQTGGNRSATTKARLNAYGPCPVYQSAGKWYFDHAELGDRLAFEDGMRLYPHAPFEPGHLTTDVLGMFSTIWRSSDLTLCPVLADALEEAGAPDALTDLFRRDHPRLLLLALYTAVKTHSPATLAA